MEYGRIPGIDKPVSRVAQGIVPIGGMEPEDGMAMLDAVHEMGCNLIDTSSIYGGGKCDRILGRWVRERGVADKVVVLAKCAHHNQDRQRVTPFDISADLHDTLARMQTEHVDLLVLHRDDPSVPVGPIVDRLNELKAQGKIDAFGGSNWSHERIAEANAYAADNALTGFAVSSPNLTLAEMVVEPWGNCIGIGGEAGADARAWYAAHDVAVVPWSSLAAGFFSGRYTPDELRAIESPQESKELPVRCYTCESNIRRLERVAEIAAERGLSVPQIALAYVLNLPANVFPLVGCDTPEQFAANAAAVEVTLTPEELAYLDLQSDTR